MEEKKIRATFEKELVYSDTREAISLFDKSRFGELKDGKIVYSLVEALYLNENEKMNIYEKKNKRLTKEEFIKEAKKIEEKFTVRYIVFKELRSRGYIVKTALKFGADFRVYDRGIKPGEDHAKWIVFPVFETDVLTWFDFAAKNRVAHSTRKKLLLAVVDAEKDVSFWESGWIKP